MLVPYTVATPCSANTAYGRAARSCRSSAVKPARAFGAVLGEIGSRLDLGLLGMALSAIALYMIASGFAVAEMTGAGPESAYRLGTFLPVPGVLGPLFWQDLLWLAVPTNAICGLFLPITYVGVILWARRRAPRPRHARAHGAATIFLTAVLTATIVAKLDPRHAPRDPAARRRHLHPGRRRPRPVESRKIALPAGHAAHVVLRSSYAEVPTPSTPRARPRRSRSTSTGTRPSRSAGARTGWGSASQGMDTAQRFELGWVGARELLRRTGELGLSNGFVGGASSDHRESIESVDDLAEAILEQVAFVADQGGLPIVLPQPWMPANGMGEEDYVRLYTRIADGAPTEILIHWLGEAFHPGIRGYFEESTGSSTTTRRRSAASSSRCSTRSTSGRCALGSARAARSS